MMFNQLYKIIIVIRMISIKVIMGSSQDHMPNASKSWYRLGVLDHKYCPKYFLGTYPDKFIYLKRNFADLHSSHSLNETTTKLCHGIVSMYPHKDVKCFFLFSQYTLMKSYHFVPYYWRQTKQRDGK